MARVKVTARNSTGSHRKKYPLATKEQCSWVESRAKNVQKILTKIFQNNPNYLRFISNTATNL
jgi:hypothetical protein